MTAERFRQIRNVFEAAIDHSDVTRASWLDEACRDDAPLRAEVEALLKQYQKRSGILDAPALGISESAEMWRMEGRRLGVWEILREIGRGGMAVVYLARRADGAFHMRAAVKVLTTRFVEEEIRKRFQQERDILAQLNHPNIARLLDGGTTEEGLPYLVMEYVDGQPLTAWCDARHASVEQRLRLFERLCGVVHYLHEHHVIHRDLKPTNVLVNASGSVKLLDFGISKLLEPASEKTLLLTRSGLQLLTPEYASPEQVRGERVTPQTDVYALGVMLYELLTGRRPYRLGSRVMHEVVRAICEDEAERPSMVVRMPNESLDPVATSRLRQSSPEHLSQALRGDLDEMVMKALRKTPERRYRSARQFAEDLSAHSQHKPVLARRDSWLVRWFQAMNRHRAFVALVILVSVLLVSGAVTIHTRAIVYGAAVVICFGFWYAATDRKVGRRVAGLGQYLVTVVWVCTLVVLFRGTPLRLPPPVARIIHVAYFAAVAVYSLSSVVGWIFRRQWAGELVLDAGRAERNCGFSDALWSLWLTVFIVFPARDGYKNGLVWIFSGALLLFGWATVVAGRLQFRQRGIVSGGRLIPWDEIESWTWLNREGLVVEVEDTEEAGVLEIAASIFGSTSRPSVSDDVTESLDLAVAPAVLRIERRRLLQFLPPLRIWVSRSKVDDITRVMNRYLSEWPT